MINPKVAVKNKLERVLVSKPFIASRLIHRAERSSNEFQIIIPHRLNWRLTAATVRAFQRLTEGEFIITLVVNFDSVPSDLAGLDIRKITIVKNEFTPLGSAYRNLFGSENGSMFNALALQVGLDAEPDFKWAFIAHNDSAPLIHGWQQHFYNALDGGLVCGNLRDRQRVFAAHSSGTLFNQREFLKRRGTVWPKYLFGKMLWDVSDGITVALHDKKNDREVPVLPNNLQEPKLGHDLDSRHSILKKFIENGTNLSFSLDRKTPVFAHMGRGTPRSQQDPFFKHKLPVDYWIEYLDSLK